MATDGHGIVISILAFVIVCNLCSSSFNKGRFLDSGSYVAERNSAVVQERVSCSNRAPNSKTMAKNISHLFMDDGLVVMGNEEAARSSLERTER